MQNDRLELAKLALAALPKRERKALLETFARPTPERNAAPAPERILRRRQVAEMLAQSARAVDRLAESGALPRVRFPGRSRGAGFRLGDVQRLIGAGA